MKHGREERMTATEMVALFRRKYSNVPLFALDRRLGVP
jgi:hypothetical protein